MRAKRQRHHQTYPEKPSWFYLQGAKLRVAALSYYGVVGSGCNWDTRRGVSYATGGPIVENGAVVTRQSITLESQYLIHRETCGN
jgi:hypothetical protein